MNTSRNNYYINKVENWLRFMGINSINRIGDSRLDVKLITSQSPKERYKVHFYFFHDHVRIESYVFKGVSGPAIKLELFQKALLAYSGANNRLAFALVPLENSKSGIVLKTWQSNHSINPKDLEYILDSFDSAYVLHVPRIRETANELGLKFDGKGLTQIKDLLSYILGEQ